jgi:hypothetical protein
MKTPRSFLKLLRIATLAGLIVWAGISLLRLFQESFSTSGGNNLYTYWYAGHFIREGKDYYKAFINVENDHFVYFVLTMTLCGIRHVSVEVK